MKNIFLTVLLAISLFSCEDLLDTEPRQSVDISNAPGNVGMLTALIYDNYDIFQDNDMYGSDLVMLPEVMGDNLENTSTRQTFNNQYLFLPRAHMGFWREGYQIISQANFVLESSEAVADEDDRNWLTGQAYVQRALAYFSLMNAYSYMPSAIPGVNGLPAEGPEQNKGGVPLLTDSQLDIELVKFPERASVDAVYDQIRSDLDEAIAALENSGGVTLFNKAGAMALASRVALYQGDYNASITFAEQALSTSGIELMDRSNYLDGWTSNINPEGLFVLNFDETEAQGQNGPHNLYTSDYTVNTTLYTGDGDHPVNSFLTNYFNDTPDDIRGTMIRPVVNTGRKNEVGTPELIKFAGKGGVDFSDAVAILRVAEMYLNIAEAAARSNPSDETLALSALNQLRTARLGAGYEIASTGQQLIDDIMFERRIELLGEGHRFFDLKRNGMDIDKRVSAGFITDRPNTVIEFSDFRILSPIPNRELDVNINMEQNFGY